MKARSGRICVLQYARVGIVNIFLLSAVETLPHFEVSDVLPSCPYNPSYLVSRKLIENEAFSGNFVSRYIKIIIIKIIFNKREPIFP